MNKAKHGTVIKQDTKLRTQGKFRRLKAQFSALKFLKRS